MKKLFILLIAIVSTASAMAQTDAGKKAGSKFNFKFYGRIRGDLMYNSRASQESVDGLFYMYPLDRKNDAAGKDLNAVPASNFYMLYTRLGVDMTGPGIGKAKTSAKVEIDFRGTGTSFALPRMRQAYVQLDWQRHSLLIGQTWHPLFGDVSPNMLNLSTGAPFQPFSRTPMLRYQGHAGCGLHFTAATLWQMQYNSTGPDGKSYKYLKNSCIPEVFIGMDYKHDGWTAGIGAEMLSLKPRQQSTVDNGSGTATYKVCERITTFAAEAHIKYASRKWSIAAKSTLGENLAHASMLGGYAVCRTDAGTGRQHYTPYRHSSTWINVVYGKKWQPALFLGYSKNLGTPKSISGATYGTGLDIDQLAAASATLSYNLPHWKIGAEFTPTIAWYGTPGTHGRISQTHSVTNYRALAVAMYIF